MSVISEKVRTAIFAKLNVSGVTSLVGTYTVGVMTHPKIFESMAPDDISLPYVIFSRHAPGPVTYGFNYTNHLESDLWLIKVVVDEDSDTSKSPQQLAAEILAACETAIGNSLTLTGHTARWVARSHDMPSYQEPLGDRTVFHRGFFLKVATS